MDFINGSGKSTKIPSKSDKTSISGSIKGCSFIKEGFISHDRITSLEKNLIIYMTLIGNVIKQLNDFALGEGINKEFISGRLDQVSRLGETMYTEFEKYFVDGKLSFYDKQEETLY